MAWERDSSLLLQLSHRSEKGVESRYAYSFPPQNLAYFDEIYATSEERKQRNRQAQAAFRERRTEYIKQLEADIRQRDEQLQTLQQSHRSTTDECLMLRYKNSLLERILLEKGELAPIVDFI